MARRDPLIAIRVPAELQERIRAQAERQGISLSELVRQSVNEYLRWPRRTSYSNDLDAFSTGSLTFTYEVTAICQHPKERRVVNYCAACGDTVKE